MTDARVAQVLNAADRDQVRRAGRKDRDRAARVATDAAAVLASTHGRRFCWDLLERAGVYRSIWDPTARIHYNAGRQDFGHELMALLVSAQPDLYLLMEQEARARQKRDDAETDAAHTAPASATTHETSEM